MNEPRKCPQCGTPLPGDALEGLCPQCMARVVFGEGGGAAEKPPANPAATIKVQPESDIVIERTGMRIGRYKLLEQIGEGGFGVVYMAEQIEPVQRKVALKVVKAGMDTKEVIARFEAERQALALMDHPNIAKILDAGVIGSAESEISNRQTQIHGGRPYFVMELVKGIPITEFCDLKKLSPTERLELFIKVCSAVQHAHQKGIIHRDIKPSNVLVTLHDGTPVPKVIDFGIAKALGPKLTEKTLFTGFAHLLGTPAYMSPEQAELSGLDIDTRSDIYSLGVLLYELLTGVTPFDKDTLAKAALDEVRRMIRETEPPKPSTRLRTLGVKLSEVAQHRGTEPAALSRLVQGDLDWIVMKCLEKDRKRRYETANGLAMDVQRHLHDEPVVACPPSATYRIKKLVRKHRVGVAVTACFALLLAAASIVSTVLALWANRERHHAEKATLVARESEADTKAFAEFLVTDVLAAARPKGRDGGLGIDVTVAQALEDAEATLEKRFRGRPRAEATARHSIGVTWRHFGRYAAASNQLTRALAIREREFGPAAPECWDTRNSYAVNLNAAGHYAEARVLFERNLEIFRNSSTASNAIPVKDVIPGMINLAVVYRLLDRKDDALKLLRETVDLATDRLGRDARGTWDARSYLASAQYHYGDYERAAAFYEEELAWFTNRYGLDNADTISSMNNLGLAYLGMRKFDKAIPLLTNAFNFIQTIFTPSSPEAFTARDNLAGAFAAVARMEDAIRLAGENLKACEEDLPSKHPTTLNAMLRLASLYARVGQLTNALPLFQKCYELNESAGPNTSGTLNALGHLADAYAQGGDFSNAIPRYETALARARVALGSTNGTTLGIINNLASAYSKVDRLPDALPLYEEAVNIATNLYDLKHIKSAQQMHNLALAWREDGQLTNAVAMMRQAVRSYEAALPAGDDGLLKPRTDLGQLLAQTGSFEEAEPLLRSGYERIKQGRLKLPAADRARLKEAFRNIAEHFESTGQADQAAKWKTKLAEFDATTTPAKP